MQVDLRSDTVTRPDAAMRRAMAEAEVGDDVFGEDPTVKRLEAESAEVLGYEAALFVPSGTMGNQIALRLHAAPGNEVICGLDSHVFLYEMGGMAALSGLLAKALPTEGGLLQPAAVEQQVSPDSPFRARTRVLVLENSVNMAGGRTYSRDQIFELLGVARRHRLAVHLDGARIFNAALARGVAARELAQGFDSVMFCLSKGLGAPVGSILCGSRDFIREAWRVRKLFGGGMRQVGVLAAAGLLALRHGPEHLLQDHDNAAFLATELANIPGLHLDPRTVETNIVIFRVEPTFFGQSPFEAGDAARFCAALAQRGVLAIAVARDQVRMVTHRDVNRDAVAHALAAVAELARHPHA